MTSSLGALQAAYSGLAAAQVGIDVTGQNIDNANTTGYVRETVQQSATGGPALATLATGAMQPGQGVTVNGIVQQGSTLLDAQVRTTNGSAGYSGTVSTALSQLETTLGEPSTDAISGSLQSFWAAWQDVSNQPGVQAPVGALLGQANSLVTQISNAYQQVQQQWSSTSSALGTQVSQLNADASQVAQLNAQIRTVTASGGDPGTLIDQRTTVVEQMSTLAGATVSQNADGTVNVLIGGGDIVSGTSARSLQVTGTTSLEGAATDPVQLVWSDQSGGPAVTPSAGQIAGDLALLAPATSSGGGAYAQTAAALDTLASQLTQQVNAVSETGATSTGATGTDFFALQSGVPAALGLSVVPTDVSGVAVAAPGAGAADGSIADAISQLGTGANAPDKTWAASVVALGTQSQVASQQATLDQSAQAAATTAQQSQESVDLDQESMNLIAYQHAYEGSARVMTTLDDMLDQLINHTGIVGLES